MSVSVQLTLLPFNIKGGPERERGSTFIQKPVDIFVKIFRKRGYEAGCIQPLVLISCQLEGDSQGSNAHI